MKNIILAICASIMTVSGFAQGHEATKNPVMIPKLEVLVQKALARSPKLRMQDKQTEAMEREKKIHAADWTDRFFVHANAFSGASQIGTDNTTDINNYQILTLRNDLAYNVGVGMRVTLGDVVKRSKVQRRDQSLIEKTKLEHEMFEQDIASEVALSYDNYLMALDAIKTRSANLEAHTLAYEVADQTFKAGKLQVTEYSLIVARKVTAQEEFEKAQSLARYHLHQLQVLCGPF